MRSYVILNQDEVETINFDEVMEISSDTLRFSVDGDKTFVKFEGDTPDFLAGKTTYTHSEILAILQTEEWTPSNPE
jgi:hypothetical protein|tara:strand:- start:157 stop:384 length:228 start_codon:yes stop_codon:yes gene_type:complete